MYLTCMNANVYFPFSHLFNFSFDKNNTLQTDLYKKPTDARCFLNFSSCHPAYTFSGTVFSQALRLRRIINNDERLLTRLNELAEDFVKCKYPRKMVEGSTKTRQPGSRCAGFPTKTRQPGCRSAGNIPTKTRQPGSRQCTY